MLTGESGTGKGLLARAIHEESSRSRGTFVAVNCASVPESLFESEFFGHARGAFTGAVHARRGLLEQASGGTLFLDEVGELAPALQAKLLTAIEDREFRRLGGERPLRVDIRVTAATSVDLEAAVSDGRFRRDLLHRLLVLSYRLPPLRERGDDVEQFAMRFLQQFGARYDRPARSFDGRARDRLLAYPWPGNVRQLANAVEAAVLACDGPRITLRHLPPALLNAANEMARAAAGPAPASAALASPAQKRTRYAHYGDPLEERRRIEAALRRWQGNKTRAAMELGMARNTLRARLRAWAEESASGSVAEQSDASEPAR